MACLSVFKDGFHVVCANPIFPTSEIGTSFTFEILEVDASALKRHVGEAQHYHIDSVGTFFGVLQRLERRPSTHVGLSLLRHKPTLSGVMTVHIADAALKH